MKLMKYVGLAVVATLMLLVLVPSCAPTPKVAEPVKIGALLSYTGPAAGCGQLHEMGIELRLDEAGWEVAGRKIELIKEDTEGKADVGLDKTRKLVEHDKVDVVLGPLQSDVAFAVGSFLAPRGVPNIAYLVHSGHLLEYETVFLTLGEDKGQVIGLGRYLSDVLGYKTISFTGPDFIASYELSKGVKMGFKGSVVKEAWFPFGTMDFAPFFTAVGKPDVLWTFFTSPPTAMRFIEQYREFGIKFPLVITHLETAEPILPAVGDKCLGIVGQTPYTWRIDNDLNRQFVTAFENKYGAKPTCFEASAYVATGVFLEAVKATKGDTTPEKIVEALKKVSMDTICGPLHFENRSGVVPTYIVKAAKLAEGVYCWEVIDSYITRIPEE